MGENKEDGIGGQRDVKLSELRLEPTPKSIAVSFIFLLCRYIYVSYVDISIDFENGHSNNM